MKRPALLVSVIVAAMLVSGCAGIKRAWHAFLTPAQAQTETPLQQPDPWVPMNSTWNVHPVPVWPSRGYSTGGQADGLAIVIHELDRVARLVEKVSRMPPDAEAGS